MQYGGTSTVSRGKDILNDRMTVMRKMENGKIRIIESYDASAEPTHYVRNSSGTVTGYQDVSPFISSRMRAGKHQVYTLVRVRKQEPNLGQDRTLHNNQKYLAFQFVNSGHMLHTILEGSAWNNSEGCAVIMEMGEAYYDTINMFKLSDSLEIYDVNKYGYFYMNRK